MIEIYGILDWHVKTTMNKSTSEKKKTTSAKPGIKMCLINSYFSVPERRIQTLTYNE